MNKSNKLSINIDTHRCIWKFILSIVFCIIFTLMIFENNKNTFNHSFLVFFAACALFWARMLIPGMRLELDETGFTLVTPLRCCKYHWQDVEKFGVFGMGFSKVAYFRLNSTFKPKIRQMINRMFLDCDDVFPDAFELQPAELIDLLRDWQLRHTKGDERTE